MDERKHLEDISDKRQEISSLRALIADREKVIESFEKAFSEAEPSDTGLVKEIFEKYGTPGVTSLDETGTGSRRAYSILITRMFPFRKECPELDFLFPLEGFKGKKGECLLTGHVKFTREELLVLDKYEVGWHHMYIGSPYGH